MPCSAMRAGAIASSDGWWGMSASMQFALVVLLIGGVGVAAALASRLTSWLRVPAPALVFIAAAVAVQVHVGLHAPPHETVERLVSLALVCILFDGGMHIGRHRFRAAAVSISVVGTIGTFMTVGGVAAALHLGLGLTWYPALLVATAVAPTDPAVVFSVFGNREVSGHSATILEGESGANDPVGIALMTSLISAGGLSGHAFAHVAAQFIVQMAVGLGIGLIGGLALLWFIRSVALPSEGLYPLRTLACALALFGLATLAHGSGFLAVFVAGIVIGDARVPFKPEIEQFHGALASLGEIAAFVALGLTVDLSDLTRSDVWVPGLVLGVALAIAIRPLLVGLCLIGAGLARGELAFVLFAGLKGAVPILLGTLLLSAHLVDARRLYGIVVIVVLFSVLVQGALVPVAARWLRVPMRLVEPHPWELGVRLLDEPDAAHRLRVSRNSRVDGRTLRELIELGLLPANAWVSVVVRAGQLPTVTDDLVLQAGDELVILADPQAREDLRALFGAPGD